MKRLFLFLLIGYLGLHNGQLAIYRNGLAEPLPYRAELFSQFDQDALKKGIPFHSETQLNSLLEDFLS